MKQAIIIVCVVCVGLIGVNVDGGLFFNRRRCKPNVVVPIQSVDIPIEELILDVPGTPGATTCVDGSCAVEPSSQLAVRVLSLEKRLAALELAKPVAIDYDAIVANLPPVKMEIHHENGMVYTQSKPLGEAIRLRLVPQ